MPNDPNKAPQPPNLKTLSSDWTTLINQLKKQPSPKLQLPPILSQRKSPLQNYKNAKKLQQATYSKSKTVTQKILDLSKRRKLSTVNFTQDLNKIGQNQCNTGQKRSPSQIFCHLTDEEKELLASKELKRNEEQLHSVEKKGKTIDNAKDIVKQIRELYEEQRCKEYEKSYRDLCAKEWKKVNAKDNEKIIEQEDAKGHGFKLKIFDNEGGKQEKGHSIKLKLDENQESSNNDNPTEMNHTQQPSMDTNRNSRKLSFSISQDYKSLHFHNRQQFNSDLAKLLFKRRSIQPPHINQKPAPLTTNSHKHLTSYNQQPLNCQHTIQNEKHHNFQQQHGLKNIKGRHHGKKPRNISRARYDGERFRFNKYEPWESSVEEDKFQRIKGFVEGELTIQNYRTLEG